MTTSEQRDHAATIDAVDRLEVITRAVLARLIAEGRFVSAGRRAQ